MARYGGYGKVDCDCRGVEVERGHYRVIGLCVLISRNLILSYSEIVT